MPPFCPHDLIWYHNWGPALGYMLLHDFIIITLRHMVHFINFLKWLYAIWCMNKKSLQKQVQYLFYMNRTVPVDFIDFATAIARYVESHHYYSHVFHDWSNHVVNRQSMHFTLQQLTSTLGLHKMYEWIEHSFLYTAIYNSQATCDGKARSIWSCTSKSWQPVSSCYLHGFKVWQLNGKLTSDLWIWLHTIEPPSMDTI